MGPSSNLMASEHILEPFGVAIKTYIQNIVDIWVSHHVYIYLCFSFSIEMLTFCLRMHPYLSKQLEGCVLETALNTQIEEHILNALFVCPETPLKQE